MICVIKVELDQEQATHFGATTTQNLQTIEKGWHKIASCQPDEVAQPGHRDAYFDGQIRAWPCGSLMCVLNCPTPQSSQPPTLTEKADTL